jgi:hypothetical protein
MQFFLYSLCPRFLLTVLYLHRCLISFSPMHSSHSLFTLRPLCFLFLISSSPQIFKSSNLLSLFSSLLSLSLISHLSSLISHLSSLISHLSSLIFHLSSLISHLSSLSLSQTYLHKNKAQKP